MIVASSTSNSRALNDVSAQKCTISNLLGKHSFDQKSNNLSHEVPHSTPEVDGNNGSVQVSSCDLSSESFGNSTGRQSMITSKLQTLDGEKNEVNYVLH